MRKLMVLGVLVGLLAGVMVLPAGAQGGTLAIGDVVEGELSAEMPQMAFTFEGQAGAIIMAQMTVGFEYNLDPSLQLLDPSGAELASNDDFNGLNSLILAKLPVNGTYTLVASRSSYSDGSDDAWGPFTLSLESPAQLQPGGSVTATVLADYEQNKPSMFVVMPEESGTWMFTIEQPGGELAASVDMMVFSTNDYLFDLSEAAGLRKAVLYVDVEADELYVITVDQSLFSFSFTTESIEVTLSAALAE